MLPVPMPPVPMLPVPTVSPDTAHSEHTSPLTRAATAPGSDSSDSRSGFGTLVRALASSLVLEPVSELEPAPFVYTAAIHTTADLVSSLVGITELSREHGFSRDPETNYGNGGRNATYHVDHWERPISLSVNCNPLRQTVAIAVSGLDADETHRCFQDLELALFGSC
jgi:hypothetical protein